MSRPTDCTCMWSIGGGTERRVRPREGCPVHDGGIRFEPLPPDDGEWWDVEDYDFVRIAGEPGPLL